MIDKENRLKNKDKDIDGEFDRKRRKGYRLVYIEGIKNNLDYHMKILHYFLGVPPYRSGGLNQYAYDLAVAQQKKNNDVSILYPGGINLLTARVQVKRQNPYVKLYELVNTLPVSLFYGIRDYTMIDDSLLNIDELKIFIDREKFDIIHIHTFMGLGYKMLDYFKNSLAKLIYTSHDYYGLCPKVNFIDYRGALCSERTSEKCSRCNIDAVSDCKLRLRNSPILCKFRSIIPNYTKQIIKKNILISDSTKELTVENVLEYTRILECFDKMFKLIDCFHFNSKQTQRIYSQYIDTKPSQVIPITHGQIKDLRRSRTFEGRLRIGYLGNLLQHKGISDLLDVLTSLYHDDYDNWELVVGGVEKGFSSDLGFEINCLGKYKYGQLPEIFNSIDVLVVPSICYETFNFITLEALSFGVPVIVSHTVGAKDLISQISPQFIYNDKEELRRLLIMILKDSSILKEYNHMIICNDGIVFSIYEHADMMCKLYESVLKF